MYDTEACARTDLRIDFAPKRDAQPDAVDALREILGRSKPVIHTRRLGLLTPACRDGTTGWRNRGRLSRIDVQPFNDQLMKSIA